MSELDEHGAILDLGAEGGDIANSPGTLLRQAREAAGVHISALAASLKIPVSKIEALESNNFSVLPDPVFARALASSICRVLALDAAPVLKLMPKKDASVFFFSTPRINASFKDSSQKSGRNSFLIHATRPVGGAVLVLLLGALAVGFLPFGGYSEISADDGAEAILGLSEPDSGVALALPTLGTESAAASESAADLITVPLVADVVSTELARVLPDAVAVVSANLIEFRARGESWVQVRDATKNVVFERTLAKGESASTTGTLPFTVVIGRADVTEVLVQGKVFDLAGVAKENVARFEVKQ